MNNSNVIENMPYKAIYKASPTISKLPKDKNNYIALWYQRLQKNDKDGCVPMVSTYFKRIDSNGNLGSWFKENIALTDLKSLRMGNIYKNQMLIGEAILKEERFTIHFHPNNWEFNSQSCSDINLLPRYPLKYGKNDKSWLLCFKDISKSENVTLVIPAIEFYCWHYGINPETMRVIATYSWQEIYKRFRFSKAERINSEKWFIELPKQIPEVDAELLANIRFNEYARKSAQNINDQILTGHANNGFVFLKPRPWHQEKTYIKVKGLWLSDSIFLTLRIEGLSPLSPPPYIDWAKEKNDTESVTSDDEEGFSSRRRKGSNNGSTPLDSSQDPGNDSSGAVTSFDGFEVLGDVSHVNRQNQAPDTINADGGDPLEGDDELEDEDKERNPASLGESSGKGKDRDKALAIIPILLSEGTLLDFWNALKQYQEKLPDQLTKVEWLTEDSKYTEEEPPHMLSLEKISEIDIEEEIKERQKLGIDKKVDMEKSNKWLQLDKECSDLRGILCIRCKFNDEYIYCIEIQRRIVRRKGAKESKEENFQGIIYKANSDEDNLNWITAFRKRIRFNDVKTKDIKATKGIPLHGTFNHSPAKKEKFTCQNAVKNAFLKMQIEVDILDNQEESAVKK